MSDRPRIVCPSGEGGLAALFDASPLRERLEAVGDVVIHLDDPDQTQVRDRLAEADAGLLTTHLTPDTVRAVAGRLRLLAFTGTGAASYVDLPTARVDLLVGADQALAVARTDAGHAAGVRWTPVRDLADAVDWVGKKEDRPHPDTMELFGYESGASASSDDCFCSTEPRPLSAVALLGVLGLTGLRRRRA